MWEWWEDGGKMVEGEKRKVMWSDVEWSRVVWSGVEGERDGVKGLCSGVVVVYQIRELCVVVCCCAAVLLWPGGLLSAKGCDMC